MKPGSRAIVYSAENQRVFSAPRHLANGLYVFLGALVSALLFLQVLAKLHIHHLEGLRNGMLFLAAMVLLFFINQYVMPARAFIFSG